MGRPLFSCVIPVKGERPFFKEALASLASQGLGDELEIIVQDADVEPDKGQSDALNKGFAKSKGEWLFWLNADDVLLPGALERVKKLIGCDEDAQWIAGNLVYIDAEGKVIRCAWDRGCKCTYRNFPVRIFGPSSFFRHSLFESATGFDPRLRYSMDTDMWCRFREAGYWYSKLPGYLWGFRVHEGSLTSGDLVGKTPPPMAVEADEIDRRYGLCRHGWNLTRLRISRMLDGSYLRSFVDTSRYRGKSWRDIQ